MDEHTGGVPCDCVPTSWRKGPHHAPRCWMYRPTATEAGLRQALWDVYGILGFDQDGVKEAPLPAQRIPDLPELLVRAAREFRAEYDDLLGELSEAPTRTGE